MGISDAAASPGEPVPVLPRNRDIHAHTRGIIYSFINVEANHAMQKAKISSKKPPSVDDMIPFYRSPFGIHLNKQFIE